MLTESVNWDPFLSGILANKSTLRSTIEKLYGQTRLSYVGTCIGLFSLVYSLYHHVLQAERKETF
jgi:hypothetical protein